MARSECEPPSGWDQVFRKGSESPDEVRKYAKFVFYLTSRDVKTVRRSSCGLDNSDRYFDQEHFKMFKSYGSNSGFRVSVTLTLTFDLCFIFCHTHCAWCTGIYMRSFIRIRPVLMGDMPRSHTHIHTHTYIHTHTPTIDHPDMWIIHIQKTLSSRKPLIWETYFQGTLSCGIFCHLTCKCPSG